jgi:hypothetical protein
VSLCRFFVRRFSQPQEEHALGRPRAAILSFSFEAFVVVGMYLVDNDQPADFRFESHRKPTVCEFAG